MSQEIVKFVIIGDKESGKSSLILRYSDNEFIFEPEKALGMDGKIRMIDGDDIKISTQVWELPADHFLNLRSAGIVIITVDLSQPPFSKVTRFEIGD